MHINVCVCMYMHVCVCVYIYMHVCVCIYIHIHTHTHTHTYIHTHTFMCKSRRNNTVKNPKIAINLKTRPDGNFSFLEEDVREKGAFGSLVTIEVLVTSCCFLRVK